MGRIFGYIAVSCQGGDDEDIHDSKLYLSLCHLYERFGLRIILHVLPNKNMKTYEVEIKDFTDVSVEECIKRDLTRPNSVGEAVIRKMYTQYLKPKAEVMEYKPNTPDAIICDIDGTLASMVNRGPFEWKKVGQDEPIVPIINVLKHYWSEDPGSKDPTIILFSGRDSSCRNETVEWLRKYDIKYDFLYMRSEGDMRKDAIVKRELFDAHVRGVYNVLFVLDDRNQVVDMWRNLGLTCLQVAPGDF